MDHDHDCVSLCQSASQNTLSQYPLFFPNGNGSIEKAKG